MKNVWVHITERLNLRLFTRIKSVSERERELLMPSELPHHTVRSVVFNTGIKH
jgi:hypothetical protein